MAAKLDKRQRSDLDAFVLALLIDGVATPYEMQSLLESPQGRLFLHCSVLWLQVKPGSRNRVMFSITAKGEKWLEAAWLPLVEGGPTADFDSDLRIFLLAIYRGTDPARARKFLRSSIERRTQTLAKLQQNTSEKKSGSWLTEQYHSLRMSNAIALLKASGAAQTND